MDAAILRDMQVRWLHGEEISLTEMISIENVFNRTAAALGTKRRPKKWSASIAINEGQLKQAGVGPSEIARQVGISRTSVFRILNSESSGVRAEVLKIYTQS